MHRSTVYATAIAAAAATVALAFGANYFLPKQGPRPQLQITEMQRLPLGHFCVVDECQYRLACIDLACQPDPGQHVPNT